MKNKTALVTGGSGFLGTHLVNRLLKDKRVVTVFDLKPPKNKEVNYIEGDVRDLHLLKKATKNIDTIFHLASLIPQTGPTQKEYKEVIIDGTENVLKACKENKVKLVYVSSTSVYGRERDKPIKETFPKNPIGSYGIAKWESEQKCQEYVKQGLDVEIIRPMTIIGPGISGVFKKFLSYVKKGYPIFTIGNGNNRIQMVSASDCVEALILAEKYKKSGEAFNIGSENIPTFKQQLEALIKHANSSSFIVPIPAKLAKTVLGFLDFLKLSPLKPDHYSLMDKNSIVDITKAKRLLRWKPQKNNIDMILEAYDDFLKQ